MSCGDDASDVISPVELMELQALVERLGWDAAGSLLMAVAGIERMDELKLVTKRELATLRVALTVAATRD